MINSAPDLPLATPTTQLWTPNICAQLIQLARLSHADVATAVGVSSSVVGEVVYGARVVTYETCERLVELVRGAGINGVDAAMLLRQVVWQSEYSTCDLTALATKLEVVRRAREWVRQRR